MIRARQWGILAILFQALCAMVALGAREQSGEPTGRAIGVRPSSEAHASSPSDTNRQEMGNIHLFLIGINNYKDPLIQKLRFPASDISLFASTMAQYKLDVYREIHTQVFSSEGGGQPADRQTLTRSIKRTLGQLQPNDLFIFYFSGHGMSYGKENLLIVQDTVYDKENMERTAQSALALSEVLSQIKAAPARKKLVILDCCHSAIEASKSVGVNPAKTVSQDFFRMIEENNKSQGVAVLSSCSFEQVSFESEDFKQGVFSYYLSRALSGEADTMKEGPSGYIDLLEISEWVTRRVGEWAASRGKQQSPFMYQNLHGNFYMTRPGIKYDDFWKKYKAGEDGILAAMTARELVRGWSNQADSPLPKTPAVDAYLAACEQYVQAASDVEKHKCAAEVMRQFTPISLSFKDVVDREKSVVNGALNARSLAPPLDKILGRPASFLNDLRARLSRPLNDFEYLGVYNDILAARKTIPLLQDIKAEPQQDGRFVAIYAGNKKFIADLTQKLIFTYRYEEQATWQAAHDKAARADYLGLHTWRLPHLAEFQALDRAMTNRLLFGFAMRLTDFYWCAESDGATAQAFSMARGKMTANGFRVNDTQYQNYYCLVAPFE